MSGRWERQNARIYGLPEQYLDYAVSYPIAASTMHGEIQHHPEFSKFCDRSGGPYTAWDLCIWAPCTRLGLYIEQLEGLQSTWTCCPQEMQSIGSAIDELKGVAWECHQSLGIMQDRAYLLELQNDLSSTQDVADLVDQLQLTHPERALIHEGELARKDERTSSWLASYGILLDNFLVFATVKRHSNGGRTVCVEHAPLRLEDISCDPIEDSADRETSIWKTEAGKIIVREVYPFRINCAQGTAHVLAAPTEAFRAKLCSTVMASRERILHVHGLLQKASEQSGRNDGRDIRPDSEARIRALAGKLWEALKSGLPVERGEKGQILKPYPWAVADKLWELVKAGPNGVLASQAGQEQDEQVTPANAGALTLWDGTGPDQHTRGPEASQDRELFVNTAVELWGAFLPTDQPDTSRSREEFVKGAIELLEAVAIRSARVAQFKKMAEDACSPLRTLWSWWAPGKRPDGRKQLEV